MLSVQNITKKYLRGKVLALNSVSFTLPDVGFVAIIGESGSGKSTLLNILSGLEKPTEGKVTYCINGKEYGFRHHAKYLHRNILSEVFQENLFINELTLDQNIRFSTVFEKKSEADAPYIYSKLLDTVKLKDRVAHYPIEVSGGQRQRATLLRGILKNSNVILADEPTSSQDEASEKILFEVLREISREKLVVLVTHSKTFSEEYCDRILELNEGNLVGDTRQTFTLSKTNLFAEGNHFFLTSNAKPNIRDWETVLNSLKTAGKVSLSLKAPPTDNFNENVPSPPKKLSTPPATHSGMNGKLFGAYWSGFLRKKTAVVILFSLIFSILLSCLALMREIFVFNSARMTNDIFRNNGYQEVTFYLDNNSAETKAKLTKNIKDELRQNGLHPKGLMDALLLQDRISIIPSETGMYSFAGFLFYSEKSYELLAGSYPQNEEVMITDFAADSLLLQNDVYHSYEDILSSGITLQGYPLFVSGIVQTDYHQYDACFQSESADPDTMTQKSEYLHKKNDFYARILIPEKPIEVTIANGSYPFYLNGQKILQLKTDVSAPLLEEGTIHINTACANLGYRDSMLFANYGYRSIVVEEESTIPTVYLHPKDFEATVRQSQLYDGLIVELSEDFTPIATLMDNQYFHYSAISQSINDFNWTITTLADLSQYIVGVLLIILVLFAFLTPVLLGKSLDRFCGLLKSWGAGFWDIFCVESSFIFFIGGCISIIFLLGNTGITYLFSLPLSATFNINLRGLIQVSPARSFSIVGIGLVALVPYALILAVIRYRKRTLRQITA